MALPEEYRQYKAKCMFLELTWVLAGFIAPGQGLYVFGIQYGGHVHV